METITTTINKTDWIDNLLKYDLDKSFSYWGADAIFDDLVDAEYNEIDIKNLTITDIKIIYTEYDRIEDIINDYDLLENIDMKNEILLDWSIHQGFYNSGFITDKIVTDDILIELNSLLWNIDTLLSGITRTFDNKFIISDWSNH